MKLIAVIFLALLCAAVGTSFGDKAQARDFLKPGDIERANTSQAIITMSSRTEPDRIQAIRFPTVPDLQSCFSLAYSAAARSGGESSATCINAQGVVAATYFCRGGDTSPQCQAVTP